MPLGILPSRVIAPVYRVDSSSSVRILYFAGLNRPPKKMERRFPQFAGVLRCVRRASAGWRGSLASAAGCRQQIKAAGEFR
jgi:hypothetical protein